jgi:hypothetical protein
LLCLVPPGKLRQKFSNYFIMRLHWYE